MFEEREPQPGGTRSRRLLILLALLVALLPLASRVSACPFCDGGPSGVNEVKEAVFGASFWPHLLATAAPFGVLLGIAAALHFGLPVREAAQADGIEEGRG